MVLVILSLKKFQKLSIIILNVNNINIWRNNYVFKKNTPALFTESMYRFCLHTNT